MNAPVPRKVGFAEMAGWVVESCKLVGRKPHYWVPYGLFLFVFVLALSAIPVAGPYLRPFLGTLYSALGLALAHTQVAESRISVRRSFSLVATALPAILALSLLQVAIFSFIDLPVVRMIGTDEEFRLYALGEHHAIRPEIDLVHTIVETVVTGALDFAVPVALFYGVTAITAIRASLAAFVLSYPVYLSWLFLLFVIPHSLATFESIFWAALLILFALLTQPSNYLVFRGAFSASPSSEQVQA